MSIVIPAINNFRANIANEIPFGHKIQHTRFADSQLRLSIPRKEYTDTISYDILSLCIRKEQNNSNYFY